MTCIQLQAYKSVVGLDIDVRVLLQCFRYATSLLCKMYVCLYNFLDYEICNKVRYKLHLSLINF